MTFCLWMLFEIQEMFAPLLAIIDRLLTLLLL